MRQRTEPAYGRPRRLRKDLSAKGMPTPAGSMVAKLRVHPCSQRAKGTHVIAAVGSLHRNTPSDSDGGFYLIDAYAQSPYPKALGQTLESQVRLRLGRAVGAER